MNLAGFSRSSKSVQKGGSDRCGGDTECVSLNTTDMIGPLALPFVLQWYVLQWSLEPRSSLLALAGQGYHSLSMVPSRVVRPRRRPRVKASCKMYVHAAVSVGGKINIVDLMHRDD